MTFREWLDLTYYPDFDPSGLTDEEYYDLEDRFNEYEAEELAFTMDDEEEDF